MPSYHRTKSISSPSITTYKKSAPGNLLHTAAALAFTAVPAHPVLVAVFLTLQACSQQDGFFGARFTVVLALGAG